MSWEFKIRWFLWMIGIVLVILICGNIMPTYLRNKLPKTWLSKLDSFNRSVVSKEDRVSKFTSRFYFQILTGLCGGFFFFAVLGKYSQLWTLNLNAQDFWLFADILEQAKKGGFFLTRFAPQSIGYVQHGSVHPMFTWGLLTLPAFILGSTWTALIFNPLVLAGAAWMVGVLSQKRWGALNSLLFALAFLASSQVGKILNYDVHPEAAYPFFILLWFWSLRLDEALAFNSSLKGSELVDDVGRVRWFTLLFSTLFCMGTKEDSFLVLGPWLLWGMLFLNSSRFKAVLVSTGVAVGVAVFQGIAVQNWVSGLWGPHTWNGNFVINQASVGAFAGGHWSGIQSIFQIGSDLISQQGGVRGVVSCVGVFLFSRPWISLLILLPWVAGSLRFWWTLLPLACACSLIEGPNHLWNYYSAPFIGSLWFCGISMSPRQEVLRGRNMPLWSLVVALLLGGSSIQIFIPKSKPSNQVENIRNETQSLLPCIGQNGLVASHLIGLVPMDKIWTDRIPKTASGWARIDYILFSPELDLFGMSSVDAMRLYSQLSALGSGYKLVKNCGGASGSLVSLFVKEDPVHKTQRTE